MNLESLGSYGATIGGVFFAGILIGYALKKVVKVAGVVVVGLLLTGLTYLQYQQIVNINWNKLQATSQNTIAALAKAITQIYSHISNITDSNNHTTVALPISSLGIPLTGSMAMGLAVSFIKG